MESLSLGTLLDVLRYLNASDLTAFGKTCHYYSIVSADDHLWRDLFIDTFQTYKNSPNPRQEQPHKGWKREYKKKMIVLLSSKLLEYINNGDTKRALETISIPLLCYNQTYIQAAESSIRNDKPIILENLLKYCSVDSRLEFNRWYYKYQRLITLACVENRLACLRVLLDNGADITYNNTGVLLMGRYKKISLNGCNGNNSIVLSNLVNYNLESSYLFLDTMFSQITLFLCAQTGNESVLHEMVQTKRGSILINKRTGLWDYGGEVIAMTNQCNHEYRYRSTYSSLPTSPKQMTLAQEEKHQILLDEYKKMLKIRHTQYTMIEKRLFNLARSWREEWSSFTALHWAAVGGHENIVRLLLKYGARDDIRTSKHRTAYDLAVEANHTRCASLLETNMKRNINNQDLQVLEKMITSGDTTGVIKLLNSYLFDRDIQCLDRYATCSLLFCAIRANNAKILASLFNTLSVSMSCNLASDADGNSPLHIVAALGHLKCLGACVERGSINKLNKALQSPLLMAVLNNHHHMIAPMIEYGASVYIKGWRQAPVLHYAVNNASSVRLLLDAGSRPWETDYKGQSALHMAASQCFVDSVSLLLEAVPTHEQEYVNIVDSDGNTALHLALASRRTDNLVARDQIIRLLVKNGADSSLLTKTGLSVLDICTLNQLQCDPLFSTTTTPSPLQTPLEILLRRSKLPESPDRPSRKIIINFLQQHQDGLSLEMIQTDIYQFISTHPSLLKYLQLIQSQSIMSRLLSINLDFKLLEETLSMIKIFNIHFTRQCIEQIFDNFLLRGRYDLVDILLKCEALPRSQLDQGIQRVVAYVQMEPIASQLIIRQYIRSFVIQYYQQMNQASNESYNLLIRLIEAESFVMLDEALDHSLPQINQATLLFDHCFQKGSHQSMNILCKYYFKENNNNNNNKELNNNHDQGDIKQQQQQEIDKMMPIRNRQQIKSLFIKYNITKVFIDAIVEKHKQPNNYSYNYEYYLDPNYYYQDKAKPQMSREIAGEIIKVNNQQQDPLGLATVNSTSTFKCSLCELVVNDDDCEDHKLVCLNRLVTCPSCHESNIPRDKLGNHMQSSCFYLQCYQCDQYFTRDQFINHLFEHDSEMWEICGLCNQMLRGFRSAYRDSIVHIVESDIKKMQVNSEYDHLRHHCKNHMIRCHSCRCSFSRQDLDRHQCLTQISFPLASYNPTINMFVFN